MVYLFSFSFSVYFTAFLFHYFFAGLIIILQTVLNVDVSFANVCLSFQRTFCIFFFHLIISHFLKLNTFIYTCSHSSYVKTSKQPSDITLTNDVVWKWFFFHKLLQPSAPREEVKNHEIIHFKGNGLVKQKPQSLPDTLLCVWQVCVETPPPLPLALLSLSLTHTHTSSVKFYIEFLNLTLRLSL